MIVLKRSDFRGRYEVTFPSINGAGQMVEDTLSMLEKEELMKLFGNVLFSQFSTNPTDTIYDDIYNPLLEHRFFSNGLKDVLISFVYLRYQRGNYAMSTENGRVLKDSSTSKVTVPYVKDLEMFNRAVEGWRAIQMYSRTNYTDFQGLDKKIQMY